MIVPMPPMIESAAALWVEGWALPINQVPPPEFDDALMARFDDPGTEIHLQMASSSSTSILSTAIMLGAGGEDDARLALIASRLEGKADRVAAALRARPLGVMDQGLDAHLRLSLAAAATSPELPPPTELVQFAQWVVADMAGRRGSLHPASDRRLRLAALGALLACDIALLSQVVALVPAAHRKASLQWTLMHQVVDAAEPTTVDGVAGITVHDDATRQAFVRLFSMHRHPKVPETMGPEGPVDAPTIVGNYLYAWAWLRVFSPEPCTRTDWATMRWLMTG